MSEPEIQFRSRRYAALRSAHRALGDSLHPAELQRALEQGRSVRSRLQALSERSGDASADPASLHQVDRLLDELSADTLGMLHRIGLNQGRHLLQRLAQDQPDVLRVLAEIVLEGDLASDADLRMLEFLVTLLCCTQEGGKKRIAHLPGEAVPALEAAYADRRDTIDPAAAAAERALARATAGLAAQTDVGAVRDRMRQYKRELGVRMLHPQVFAALVAYNVAISNHVEGLLQDGRLQSELSQDLLELGSAPAADADDSIFRSRGFERLLTALTHHVRGEPCPDVSARSLASSCDAEALSAGEREAFDAPEEESNAQLARAAVALGLLLSAPVSTANARAELGIETGQVLERWRAELWRSMTAAAQELLADGRYAEAQRLAAVRGGQLGEHGVDWAISRLPRTRARGARAIRPGTGVPVSSPLLRQTVAGLCAICLLFLVAFWQWPVHEAPMLTGPQLSALSPHLIAAYERSDDGIARLVGTVGSDWARLTVPERREAVAEIGQGAAARGIQDVILVDDRQQIQGSFQDGEVVWVARGAKPQSVPN